MMVAVKGKLEFLIVVHAHKKTTSAGK